ncbi:MAG: hydroxymyristoyl-ACP dehydratase [Frateuria sp.]|nr:hydroxymyristoyl-ACP dehydratase [Frateuria sp.]
MTLAGYQTTLCFAPDHPSLPGHFPGRPLVAGVLLLERVAEALRAWRGERLACVREAKFVAPLEPGEAAELRLTPAGAQVRFEIRRDGKLLARGLVEGATDT